MRRTAFVIVWALSVLCSLAVQRLLHWQPVDARSVVLAVVVAGTTLAAMEWLRREAKRAKAERARLLAEIRAAREWQERVTEGAALRVTGSEQ